MAAARRSRATAGDEEHGDPQHESASGRWTPRRGRRHAEDKDIWGRRPRICMVDGCGTRLSAYNPSSVCALHGGGMAGGVPPRRTKVDAARGDLSSLCLRAVWPRVHHDQPRKEVLQRRLPHEGLPGPRHGVAPDERGRHGHDACPPRELTLPAPGQSHAPPQPALSGAPAGWVPSHPGRPERGRDHRHPPPAEAVSSRIHRLEDRHHVGQADDAEDARTCPQGAPEQFPPPGPE